MDGGVGIERFAEWCFKTADTYIDEVTEGRVWVENITVFEHSNNSASVSKPINVSTTFVNEEGTKTHVEVKEQGEEVPESKELPLEQQQVQPDPRAARVGPNVTKGNFSDPFAGTTWGNK